MGGKTEKVGKASDVKFVDPTGQYAKGMNTLEGAYGQNLGQANQYAAAAGAYDPNAYMNQFLGQAEGLSNLVSGQMSPLTQSLNGIATRQAALGSEAALSSMPGAANSGAGMAAFGQAYADPFAQAQAQLQSQQLEGTLGLWNNALGLNSQSQLGAAQNNTNLANTYAGLAGTGLSGYGQMAAGTGGMWQPTYIKKKGLLENAADLGTAAMGAAALFG
jgi:hypothetical protein